MDRMGKQEARIEDADILEETNKNGNRGLRRRKKE